MAARRFAQLTTTCEPKPRELFHVLVDWRLSLTEANCDDTLKPYVITGSSLPDLAESVWTGEPFETVVDSGNRSMC